MFESELKILSDKRKEFTDESGIINDAHEKIREILTQYNDTLRGRCAICLEDFKDLEHQNIGDKFSDR